MSISHRKRRSSYGNIEKLPMLLDLIDPDIGHGDWVRVLMAIFYETDGSEEGFELADEWSSKGEKYLGTKDVRKSWNSFKIGHDDPVTIGTLIWMAKRGT